MSHPIRLGLNQNQRKGGFTLIELLVVLAVVGVLVALLLPAVQQAREAARRTSCRNKLKQIGLALHNYHSVHGVLPPGYIRSHGTGWSAFLLPMLEERSLYETLRWGDPWNAGGPNQTACETLLPVFRCPSASIPRHEGEDGIDRRVPATYIACVSGTETEDDRSGPAGFDDPDEDGLFMENRAIPFRDVTDGTSHTVAAGETLHRLSGGRDHWAIGSPDIDAGRDVAEFLGSTAVVFNRLDEEAFRSQHEGGCHLLMADGRVRFVSETIDGTIRRAIGTRNGGETVGSAF